MKNEVNPAIFWVLVGVVAIVVVIFSFRMFSSSPTKMDTTGSEATMKRVQETGKFYEPPPGAPVPRGPGSNMPPGGYNMTAPPGR
jgi:hypothetical protein